MVRSFRQRKHWRWRVECGQRWEPAMLKYAPPGSIVQVESDRKRKPENRHKRQSSALDAVHFFQAISTPSLRSSGHVIRPDSTILSAGDKNEVNRLVGMSRFSHWSVPDRRRHESSVVVESDAGHAAACRLRLRGAPAHSSRDAHPQRRFLRTDDLAAPRQDAPRRRAQARVERALGSVDLSAVPPELANQAGNAQPDNNSLYFSAQVGSPARPRFRHTSGSL